MAARESARQQRICTKLNERGHWWVKIHQTGRGRRGVPDLLACISGFLLAIEVKGEDGRPSNHQLGELEAIRRSGGVAVIATCWEDIEALVCRLEDDGPYDGLAQGEQPPLPDRLIVDIT